jgi:hypothetical protein
VGRNLRGWIVVCLTIWVTCLASAQEVLNAIAGRQIVTTNNFISAKFSAARLHTGEVSCEISVDIHTADLKGIVADDPTKVESWWILKGSQDSSGVIHPYQRAQAHHAGSLQVANNGDLVKLHFDADQFGLHNGDHLVVLLTAFRIGRTGSEDIVLNERGLNLNVVIAAPIQTVILGGFAVAPNEGLENGQTQNALHASLTIDDPYLARMGGETHLHLLLDNLISTASTDSLAYLSGALYVEKIKFMKDALPTMPLSPFAGILASESLQNQSWSSGFLANVRLRGTQFGSGKSFNAAHDAMLIFTPIEYQDWYHRSYNVDPYLQRPDLLLSSARVRWEPIYLFSQKEVPNIDRDYSLHLSGAVWYFFQRQIADGISSAPVASRIDLELQIPFVKLRVQKRLNFPARLSIAVGNGAVPSNGYISSSSFNLGIKGSF